MTQPTPLILSADQTRWLLWLNLGVQVVCLAWATEYAFDARWGWVAYHVACVAWFASHLRWALRHLVVLRAHENGAGA